MLLDAHRIHQVAAIEDAGELVAHRQFFDAQEGQLELPVAAFQFAVLLPDARAQPGDVSAQCAELKQARGVDERFSRGKLALEILAAVDSARDSEPPDQMRGGDDLERELRPAVTLVSAWISQVAKAERIDTAMLATRTDLIELLAGEPNARLRTGWRAELLGDGVERLLAGTAGLTFDRQGGLRLVDIAAG